MKVVVVYTSNVRIRDNDEGKIPESMDPVSKTDRKEREGKVGGGEEGFGRERRTAMAWGIISLFEILTMEDDDSTVQDQIRLGDAVAERRVARQYHQLYLPRWVDEATLERPVIRLRL